jgi:GNAT superfamily N-acetyltransferase
LASDRRPSVDGIELRLARPDEHDAVGRLTREVYVGDGYLHPSADYARELGDAASRAAGGELWVAVADGRLVGTVTFCPAGSPYREVARDGEGEFRMLAVAPDARGRGVGQALVSLMLRRAHDLGYHRVRMSTMDRMAAAHRTYERLGFRRSPEDDWSPVPGVSLLGYVADLTED